MQNAAFSAANMQPQPMRYAPRPAAPVRTAAVPAGMQAVRRAAVTQPSAWFGWMVLCMLVWIIGPMMTFRAAKDPSLRNFAKMMLVTECFLAAAAVLGIMLLGGLAFLDYIF